MKNLLWLVAVVFIFGASAVAEVIRSGSLQASSDGVNVTIHWITEDETGVARFDIERRSGTDGAFVQIATVDPKGASLYEFIDNSAFRKTASLYQYRVKISYSNSSNVSYSSILTVSHTVSSVRRTWGSIKSMFR